MRILLGLVFAMALAQSAAAEGFQRVGEKTQFMRLVDGQKLKRLGVNVVVTEDGRIDGRAFGRRVTGDWRWEGGFFCRELNWGGKPYDKNCQLVQVRGDVLRFTSDKGAGIYADLRLD